MRLAGILFSFLLSIVASQGCTLLGGSEPAKAERVCTPGAYVFCRCADRTPGTKLCQDDGLSFSPCATEASGECVGGEIDDPRTGEPISKGGEPEPPPGEPSQLDACPGKSTAVAPGVEIVLEGDTSDAEEDRAGKQGACGVGSGAPDHVYRLIPTGSGALEVRVEGSDGLDPVAYLRTACDDETTQVSCAPPTPSKVLQTKLNVMTGRDYFLFVDGASGSTGKYVVTLKLTTTPFCGDGKVDPGEACDDGNKTEGDGCSNNCKRVDGNPPSGGGCPGHPVHLWPGQTVTGSSSTTSYGNAWDQPDQTCHATGTNQYQDHIYEITPHASGSIVVTVTPAGETSRNFMLTARTVCADPTTMTEGMCKNEHGLGSSPETLTLPATNRQPLYVAVDGGGITGNAGDYSISFRLD